MRLKLSCKALIFILFLHVSLNAEDTDLAIQPDSASLSFRPAESMINPAALGFYKGSELSFDFERSSEGFGNFRALGLGLPLGPEFSYFMRWQDNQGTADKVRINDFDSILLGKSLGSFARNSYGFAFSRYNFALGFRFDDYISG